MVFLKKKKKKRVPSLRNQGIITVTREGREINLSLIYQEAKKIEGLVLIRDDPKTLHGKQRGSLLWDKDITFTNYTWPAARVLRSFVFMLINSNCILTYPHRTFLLDTVFVKCRLIGK